MRRHYGKPLSECSPDLVPGSRWSDNDPREKGQRIVEVVRIGEVRCVIRNIKNGRETDTFNDRFGRAGRNGFTLVSPVPTEDSRS